MCATARQELRSEPAPAPAGAGEWAAPTNCGRGPALVTDLVAAGRAAAPASAAELLPAGARTESASPATATASIADTAVTAARAPRRAAQGRQCQPGPEPELELAPERCSRAQSRPMAPCRTGSSMYRQDSAASVMLAAIWAAARSRSGPALGGVVSTMTGK